MPGVSPTVDRVQRSVGFLRQFVNIHTVLIDVDGRLLSEEQVDLIFSSARDLKCFRWRDSLFVLDPDVRAVRDVVKSLNMRLHKAASNQD